MANKGKKYVKFVIQTKNAPFGAFLISGAGCRT